MDKDKIIEELKARVSELESRAKMAEWLANRYLSIIENMSKLAGRIQ